MVFNGTVFVVIILLLVVWISIVSVVMYRMIRHYNRLTGNTTGKTLKDVLELIVKNQKELGKRLGVAEGDIKKLSGETKLCIQRVGIVRFNPFSDTGGSQSFSLALLDGRDNGIVITSLYSRTGNRFYIKQVRSGHGVGLDLSKEELTAISKAKPMTEMSMTL
jgi:hypothetical protein